MTIDGVIKKTLLETMDEFHKICEENNLKYYLIGGALIGAIRHKGCIPWDDDIDVVMFPEDFNKLLLLKNKFSKAFHLQHRSFSGSRLLLPIARIENYKVTIDEGYYSEVTTGVFLDIFCFNDTFSTKFLQQIHFKLVAGARLLLCLKERTYSKNKYDSCHLKIFNIFSCLLYIIPRSFLNLLLDLVEKVGRIGGGQYIANLHGVWKTKEIANKKIFQKRKLYDFEGRKYWSIEDADAWLKPIYGDYMQLPPEEERKPKHIDKIISINGVKVDL